MHGDEQVPTLRWRAARAKGMWFETVVHTMMSIQDPEIMKKLHITLPHPGDTLLLDRHIEENPQLLQQYDTLKKYVSLCIEISSARCWSQIIYTVCLPNHLCVIFHEKLDQRASGVAYIRKLWNAGLDAEKTLENPGTPGSVRAALDRCMADMAWHCGQIARESYKMLEDSGWDFQDEELRKLAFCMFASPANTKHFLEDSFSHLADLVKRMARNLRMTKCLS